MNTKEIFLKRLSELLRDRNLSFKQLGDAVGLNDRTIRRWYAERSPKVETLVKLANFFKCSLDYLVGLSDTEFDYPILSDKINFTDRYLQLKKNPNCLSDAKIAAICKVSATTVLGWNRGRIPDFVSVVELCKFFDCSFEYLIGRID